MFSLIAGMATSPSSSSTFIKNKSPFPNCDQFHHPPSFINITNYPKLAPSPLSRVALRNRLISSSSRRFRVGGMPPTTTVYSGNEKWGENEENGTAKLPGGLCPEHVAVIMDGHGRWAEERGLSTKEGHFAGGKSLERLIRTAFAFGIKFLTVYMFSNENWKRSKVETDYLIKGIEDAIASYLIHEIKSQNLRISVIGERSKLPPSMQSKISHVEELSKSNKGMHLVVAISYSGRLDIVQATKRIAIKVRDGILQENDINDDVVQQYLMTSLIEVPDPDLLIRTSGEQRLSNFLLWQLAYTEFYFIEKKFPDFDEANFAEALNFFQHRKRRYGAREENNAAC
ncbi:cis-prenyltransferase 7, chloroplastic-like [Andrographis paniculata]|uniref:cis-prenyltransferase 7, chloroplastic-like n=1 Tax=Andrographis paniculata TaxID=175694 RepID=UPI0021E810C2|nr:cis-prenyltransferase 7, chloroplastic-like [Andrographis paniculata]